MTSAAHQAGIEHPADDADGDVHVDEAGPEHRDDGDDEDQEREGDDGVDEPAEERCRASRRNSRPGARSRRAEDERERRWRRARSAGRSGRPQMTRESMSRPKLSVPNGCAADGGWRSARVVEGERIVGRDEPGATAHEERAPPRIAMPASSVAEQRAACGAASGRAAALISAHPRVEGQPGRCRSAGRRPRRARRAPASAPG